MTPDEVRELMNKGLITQVINPIDIVNNMETKPEPCDYQLPIASRNTLGGVKIGAGLEIDEHGKLKVGICEGSGLEVDATEKLYVPLATKTTYGIVKVGDGLDINNDGELRLWVNSGGGLGTNVYGALEVNIGSGCGLMKNGNGSLGVNVGTGLVIGGDEKLCIKEGYGGGSNYVLPKASNTTLGGVKVGTSCEANLHVQIGADNDNMLVVNYGAGIKNSGSQHLVADIDYIYQQILTKLKADGHIQ